VNRPDALFWLGPYANKRVPGELDNIARVFVDAVDEKSEIFVEPVHDERFRSRGVIQSELSKLAN